MLGQRATESGLLRSSVTAERQRLVFMLIGTADMSATEELGRLLTELHADAVVRRVTEVVVDIRELRFMNSSCFKKFVTWVTTVYDMEPDRRYMIRFLSDQNKHWQKRSLMA